MRSLLLVGHGSHLNPNSAAAVYRYAELVRASGRFDEVTEAFWKEEPSLRRALDTVRGTDVTVIPVFISEGYFTETVIPRELGLAHDGPVPAGGVTQVLEGRTVRYARPLGVHPAMEGVILERAREAVRALDGAADVDAVLRDAALVVIGHGTTRNRNSSRVVYENAERIRQRGVVAEVSALFLDEDPRVTGWASSVNASLVIMVPFFTAEGWHTQETIPDDLGLTGAVTRAGARTVLYTPPVGTHPLVADVISRLADEASGSATAPLEEDAAHAEAWAAFTARALEGVTVGEVHVQPAAPGLFEFRPCLDAGREDLETLVTPEGVRDRVRLDDGGRYRPVHTLRNLPRGWRAVVSAADLSRTMHAVYPGTVEEAFAHDSGCLQVTPWVATARRQTGIYKRVQAAAPDVVEGVAREVCSACLRARLWADAKLPRTFLSGAPGALPCPEACTLFVSSVRDRLSAIDE